MLENNNEKRKKQITSIALYKRLAKAFYDADFNYDFFKNNKEKLIYKTYKPLHFLNKIMPSIFNYSFFYKKFEVNCKKYNSSQTQKVGYISLGSLNTSYWFERSCFEKTIELDFEMLKVSAPANYDFILKKLYGNYMEYVICNSVHGDVIFDSEMPYCEWIKNFKGKKNGEV